ncbi:glycosyltransferase [candidate division KSB1 bacterium]|nr:glycosyltransferase [candidate division KSB1 bacterium]
MKKVSIILQYNHQLGYSDDQFMETVNSIIHQNYDNWELIIVVEQGANEVIPSLPDHQNIKHITGAYKNRAQALNDAIQQSTGDYIMLVNNINSQILIRLTTLELFIMVADRHSSFGMLYSDYQRTNADGSTTDVHLLGHHIGRVRDNMDYGAVLFFSKHALDTVGRFDETYNAADLYDLRLKIASQFDIVHIEAKVNGFGYRVKAAGKKHNVFDYLMAGKDVQLEMERTVTEHLKRIGAYLTPGKDYHAVEYTASERFDECIASIVIPVFDREEFIGTAIESVQAQTVQNIEVIVVTNGGPNDPTIRGVRRYMEGGDKFDPTKPAVKLLIEDINNIGFCLNKGFSIARGKYYVQLDSDDRLKPDAVEKILAVFDSDARIGMVIGSYEVWEKHDNTGAITRMEQIPVVTHDEWTEENGRNNLLRINGAGAPRSAHIKVIKELGGFGMNDTEFCRNYGEDYDLVLRISERYRIGRVWEPIYDVIRHSGGTDHSIDAATIDRNDNAKDQMRREAIERRIRMNR